MSAADLTEVRDLQSELAVFVSDVLNPAARRACADLLKGDNRVRLLKHRDEGRLALEVNDFLYVLDLDVETLYPLWDGGKNTTECVGKLVHAAIRFVLKDERRPPESPTPPEPAKGYAIRYPHRYERDFLPMVGMGPFGEPILIAPGPTKSGFNRNAYVVPVPPPAPDETPAQ